MKFGVGEAINEESKNRLIHSIKSKIQELANDEEIQKIPAFLENMNIVLYKMDYGDIDVKENV